LFKTIQKTYGFLNQAKWTEIGKKYQKLNAKLNKRIRRYEQAKKKYRDDYFVQIHDEAMQRHLNNTVTDEYITAVIQHQLPEQTNAATASLM
jgi:acyl-ACP thioesterase